MSKPQIPVEKLRALVPLHTATVTEDHLDIMQHMNIRWYVAFFDDAATVFFANIGMHEDYYRANNAGGFALRQVINYVNEVRLGETVTIYSRIIGRTDRKIHFMLFMVNDTHEKLAATFEVLGAHADLSVRRTGPYPPQITAIIDTTLETQAALDWDVPLSGAITL